VTETVDEHAGGWTAVASFEELAEGTRRRVDLDGAAVLLVRSGERVFAVADRCTHQGAALDRGRVKVGGSLATVTCAAHGSMFGLEDGRVLRGPATERVAAFDARVVDGSVELRPRS
jgi:nitrite reductase/ring-hydroxylating ferredoxin subunit